MSRAHSISAFLFLAMTCAAHAAQPNQSLWVVADFDGDRKLDLVNISPSGEPGIDRSAAQPLLSLLLRLPAARLRARDLDGDNDRDLILETASSVPLAIWLNDGAGNFARANLEDFRYQLSHETQQSLDRALPLLSDELTDDAPRAAALNRPGLSSPDPPSFAVFELAVTNPLAPVWLLLRSRGPPALL